MTNPLVQQLFFLNSKDGAFLSVPPALKGKISVEDVREELLRKRIVNADYDRIAEVLARASGDLEWIGERFQRFDPRKNKYIHVRISDDGVYAYLSVRFPRREEQQITAGDLEYKLWESSIRVPIDREKIRKIAAEKKNVVNEVVAAGTPPVHGEDGKLIFHVKVENDPKPLILEDGRVDFHRIDSIRLVKKDQLLVTRIPPKEGKPGTNVFGEPIPYIPGGDVKL
ncbi:MAG TPA: DUF342 domain-containing protein, partial [Bacteroidetes bacterium]|nr:DUF342 domain-containing protein [Bacteroidota bacterium]